MGTEIVVDEEQLEKFIDATRVLDEHERELIRYAQQHVCDKGGFTGAMAPLGEALDHLFMCFNDAHNTFAGRWSNFRFGVRQATGLVQQTDEEVGRGFGAGGGARVQ